MSTHSSRNTWPACLLALLSILSCARQEDRRIWHTSTLLYFDTVCEIQAFCSLAEFDAVLTQLHTIFGSIEEQFSPGRRAAPSPMLSDLYSKALQVYRDSQGDFDITVASLSRLWGFQSGDHRVPTASELIEVLENIGMKRIRTQAGSVDIPSGMELDWGAIAKGYGIDLASRALMRMGIDHGFVNAGGDLYCWGRNPEGKDWQIGIKHPRNEGFLGILSLSGFGAATTGDYQRFFFHEGVRYHHVFDPKTGYPARGRQSVTVIGSEACFCDALSTALFVSSAPAEIMELYPQYGAIIVDAEGRTSYLGKSFPFRKMD